MLVSKKKKKKIEVKRKDKRREEGREKKKKVATVKKNFEQNSESWEKIRVERGQVGKAFGGKGAYFFPPNCQQ